jgi:hypothetical protein
MDEAYNDISPDVWIHHAKQFVPRCMNNEDIYCDIDENLWPNAQDRLDATYCLLNMTFIQLVSFH